MLEIVAIVAAVLFVAAILRRDATHPEEWVSLFGFRWWK